MSKLLNDATVTNDSVLADNVRIPVFDPSTGKISYITALQFTTQLGALTLASGTITSAQILSSNSSPVELIAAPGAGSFIAITNMIFSIDYNSAAYVGGDVAIRYSGGANIDPSVEINGILALTADSFVIEKPEDNTFTSINEAVQFYNQTGNPTTGNSDIKYKIWYTIETI
jgi:hypothetical protein